MKLSIFLFVFSASVSVHAETWIKKDHHHFEIVESIFRSQGVATDQEGHFWFSSQKTLIQTDSKWGAANNSNISALPEELKKFGANHIGDIDFANGKLFVPIEDGPKYLNPYIGIYDPKTLKYEKSFRLPQEQQRDGVPWVAVDVGRNSVYSAEYRGSNKINIYDISTLAPTGHIVMSQIINAIQGAKVFNGNLYVTADGIKPNDYLIYKIEIETGVVTVVGQLPSGLSEVEGLAFAGHELNILGVIPVDKDGGIRRTELITYSMH